jgi:non-specific serine/threonine protein kinase/serine/threonine-protein kinase
MLSGRRPYEVKTDSLEGIVRAVCETEPRAPSEVMADRPTEPPAARTRPQAAELRGDLDTIVLKALRKEPERRYLSAHELSEDIRRHLDGLPVMARADTLTYRAGKFVGRHQTAVAAAVLVAVSLVGGIVATLRQARIAEANRRRAERRFDDVRKLANSFLFDVHDQVRELPGSTVVRQRLVATAQEYLDSLAREAQGDLGLQRELAGAYERLGDVQGGAMTANLGDMSGALSSYHKAMAIREAVASAPAAVAKDHVDLIHVLFQQGVLLTGMGRLPEAETLLQRVTERLTPLLATRGATADLRRNLAASYQRLSGVQAALGRYEPARHSLEKAIDHGEAYCRDHPEDAQAHSNLAAAYYQDSIGLGQQGDHQAALARVRQARAIQETLHEKEPLNQIYLRGLLFSLNGEGLHLGNLGQGREAVAVYRRALELAEDMLRRDRQDRWAQASVTVAYSALGRGLIAVGELSSGLTALESGRAIGARVVAEDPANAFVQDELAVIDSSIGFGLIARGTEAALREGCLALERSLEAWRQMQARGSLAPAGAAGMEKAQAGIARCGSAARGRPSPPS